jgi:hypothetical protein
MRALKVEGPERSRGRIKNQRISELIAVLTERFGSDRFIRYVDHSLRLTVYRAAVGVDFATYEKQSVSFRANGSNYQL